MLYAAEGRTFTQSKASSGTEPRQPPLPPQCFGFGSQLTRFWGLSTGAGVVLVLSATWDSIFSVELNAQHDPHMPWFLIGDTTFLVRQSTVLGSVLRSKSCGISTLWYAAASSSMLAFGLWTKPWEPRNSSAVRSENCMEEGGGRCEKHPAA